MDLKLFFDQTEVEVDESSDSFQSNVYVNRGKMPDHDGLDIALIGMKEYRGTKDPAANVNSADEIRKQLYRLKKGFGDYGIVDLGNFRNGPKLEDTYLRLKEVCGYLMDKGTIPLIFGGGHDIDLGQFLAYEGSGKLITLLSVDQKFDLAKNGSMTDTHLKKIFSYNPNYLFNYCHLAYQSFLAGKNDMELIDQLSFEMVRLGLVKENIREIEPFVRDADMLSFDLSALQALYAPGAEGANVYGLTGEEACQISWYAGQNEKLSSIGIYNYDCSKDSSDKKTAFVAATMIWYFIEGFYHRKGEKGFKSNDYLLYEVHLGGDPESIKFYKSKKSEKWWMEVPHPESGGVFNRNRMVACSYQDYEKAQSGEVPDRWLSFLLKS